MNNPPKPFLNVSHLALLLLLAWMVFNVVQSVQYIGADYSGIPVEDYWRVPQMWPQYKALHFGPLWMQHNEHRIIFPELTFIADMALFHGRMYLPIALSGVCYLGVWCIIVWATYSSNLLLGNARKTVAVSSAPPEGTALEWPARELGLLLGGVVMFWKGCSTVIAAPFQLQFTMLQFAAGMALVSLVKLADTGRRHYLASVIVFGAIATYSSGNGMLLWVVLIAGAGILKIGKARTGVIALAGGVFTGAYFIGYRFMPSNMSENLRHPLMELGFLASYMSMPFGYDGSPAYGIIIGAVNMLLMLACGVLAWRRGLLQSKLGVIVFGLYLFMLLSALLTAAGRLDLNDSHFWGAKVARYVVMPMTGWALLAVAVVWLLGDAASRNRACVLAGAMALFFFWGFGRSSRWLESTRADFAYAQDAVTMLRNGVFDPVTISRIFPDPGFVQAQIKVLEADRKSIYARGLDKWIGQDVAKLEPQRTPVAGKVTRVYPVPGGLEIAGWADNTWLTGDHPVLFVSAATGKIAGYGRRPPAGFPSQLASWDVPAELGFIGFIHLEKPAGQRFLVYSRTVFGKLLQPLDSVIDAPAYTQADSGNLATVDGVEWEPSAAWTPNGYKAEPTDGPLPAGRIYGSGPEEKKTGQIRILPFPVPANHCIVLPVLHGPSTYGQLVEVRDADAKVAIASLPMLDGDSGWTRWRIPLSDSTRTVTIVADDEGQESFQWTALAAPQQCP